MEIWKEINENYQVSNLGRIKTTERIVSFGIGYRKIKERILKPLKIHGYYYVHVGYREAVHRLVAKAFIPNPENLPQVNHKDGVKSNNVVYNLEWCSHLENAIHAYNTGLSVRGERHPSSKLIKEDILEIRKLQGQPLKELSERFGVTKMCISKIQNNKMWKHI